MAGNSPKPTDAAEVALSAVEEALKLDFGASGTEQKSETETSDTSGKVEVKVDEPTAKTSSQAGSAEAPDVTPGPDFAASPASRPAEETDDAPPSGVGLPAPRTPPRPHGRQ